MAAKVTYLFEIFHVSFVKLIKIFVIIFFHHFFVIQLIRNLIQLSESRDGSEANPKREKR